LLFPARLSLLPVFGFLAAILAFATPAAAQTYNVVGTIIDDGRGTPVAGVDIRMADGRPLGTSQASGRFEITVNSRQANIVFRREGYRDLELNLGDLAYIVDVEITLESNVQELAEATAYAPRRALDPTASQSIEELESLQGMRIDLNDHLRQMHGIAGMNEFTSDISVHGSRTQDVTHYLGKSRIPSLRHLDFGYPGNQSVLNPRLLRGITLADNPAKGPLNQGNASALIYDLKDGDPEAIRGDVVLGSVNREFNLTSYWGQRTFTTSARYLSPNSLSTLGNQFFTSAKDCGGEPNCKQLEKPLDFSSLDLFFSTFKRDTSGAFGRHSLIIVEDRYKVLQDKGNTPAEAIAQPLIEGFQGAWLYSYEAVRPTANGDWEWGFSFLNRDFSDAYRDTLKPVIGDETAADDAPGWYPSDGQDNVFYRLGNGSRLDKQTILSGQYSPTSETFGALPSYGVELDYLSQGRTFLDISSTPNTVNLDRTLTLANTTYRLRWNLDSAGGIESSVGALWAYEGPRGNEDGKTLTPVPLASVRYTYPLSPQHKLFVETALRHSITLEPMGFNDVGAKVTPSAEVMIGGTGTIYEPLRYAWSGYSRYYKNPTLPIPEVFWNYEETRVAKSSRVEGANATLNYLPNHHVGMGFNASVIQGRYHLEDGGTLPWESNRTLDLVYNLRYLPRGDSLLSFIVTYGTQNGAPLYEHRGLWDTAAGTSTGRRAVYAHSRYPTVSRQRVDARMNIDLKSNWKPLESMRFFFEADNIFSGFDDSWASWLGGNNERRRGWTRTNAEGDLQPVVTRGLGLFIMFGIEGKLKI
jgi:hypothetical protein